MTYHEEMTPNDIQLYDKSRLGNKIRICFEEMCLFLCMTSPSNRNMPNFYNNIYLIDALADRATFMGIAQKKYDEFVTKYPQAKCSLDKFRHAFIFKKERMSYNQ